MIPIQSEPSREIGPNRCRPSRRERQAAAPRYNNLKSPECERRERQRAQAEFIRPRFVSIRDACKYLGCSRSHFYVELLSKVRTITLGKRRLVDFDSLERLADQLLAAG